jgi:hypothetical protein
MRSIALSVLALSLPAAADPEAPDVEVPALRMSVEERVGQLSEAQLKESYLRCSRAAVRGRLQSGEIAGCSIVYETLLKRVFGGDFRALIAWRSEAMGRPPRNTAPE